MSFTIQLSVGAYDGFGFKKEGKTLKRIALGWVALDLVRPEIDEILRLLNEKIESLEKAIADTAADLKGG